MSETSDFGNFRLSTGGLFYRLGLRVGVQRPDSYCVRRRIFLLTAVTLLPLALLAALDGVLIDSNLDVPLITDIKIYARFLIALPLLLAAGLFIDPLVADNIRSIGAFGFLDTAGKARYASLVDALRRGKDSSVVDLVIIALAFVTSVVMLFDVENVYPSTTHTDWIVALDEQGATLTKAGLWSVAISSPILQVVLFKWFWRFFLWVQFLYRASKIDLNLQATHPDLVGGLGILKNGDSAFIVIFLAMGTMLSGTLAQEIYLSDSTFKDIQFFILGFVVACVVMMTLPLTFFAGQLADAKRRGRVIYGALGYSLSRAFDEKWGVQPDQSAGNTLLQGGDASAVCDYSDVYGAVRGMRLVPFGLKDIAARAIALAVPFAPLAVIGIPIQDAVRRLFQALV